MSLTHNDELAPDLHSFEQQCLLLACMCEPHKPVLRRLIAFAMEPTGENLNITETALQALVISGYLHAVGDEAIVVTEQARLWKQEWITVEGERLGAACVEDGLHRILGLAVMVNETAVLAQLLDQARFIVDRAIATQSTRAFALSSLLGQALYQLGQLDVSGVYLAVAVRLFDPVNRKGINLYITALAQLARVLPEQQEHDRAVELLEHAFKLSLPRRDQK